MDVNNWLLYATIMLAATISPGPNALLVVVNTLADRKRGAFFTIFGILLALFTIALASALGIGAILEAAPSVFSVMKLAGGVYLAWLGFKLIRSSFSVVSTIKIDESAVGSERIGRGAGEMIVQAMLTSYSNPKSILFFSAVFSAFLDTSTPMIMQFTQMFASNIVIVALIYGIYAYIALRMQKRLLSSVAQRWMSRVSGLCFLGFGAVLAVDSQR